MTFPKTALLAALVAAPAFAGLNLDVRSDMSARVHLNDEVVGVTPIILKDIQPGSHRVSIEHPGTGELRTYSVLSPRSATVVKILWAGFQPGTVAPPDAVSLAPAPMYSMRSGAPAPVAAPPPPPAPPPQAQRSETRGKTHTRNTLLGLTAASQIFGGKKRDRVRQRNVGGGLILLNEMIRK